MLDMILETVAKWWATWMSGILAGAFIYLWRKMTKNYQENVAKDKAIERALVAMLRKDLLELCSRYKAAGEMSTDARVALEDLFQQYFALGGDGAFHRIYDEMKRLPTDVKRI